MPLLPCLSSYLSRFIYWNHTCNQNHILIFIVFVIIRTALFLSMEKSKSKGVYPYNPATVVLLVDLAKLVVSLLGIYFTAGIGIDNVYRYRKIGVYYFLPALFYTVNNNLIFYNSVSFDMATMRVLYNFRIFTSGLLTQVIFGKSLGTKKWLAILLLFFGCVICQWKGIDGFRYLPILLMFLQCFLSSLSGVVNDYLMKNYEESIHVQNLYLYSFNLLTNIFAAMYTGEDLNILKYSSFFKGYTPWTWFVIIVFVGVGISTSVLLKHLSAILKEFASASEMITIAFIGSLLLDSIQITYWLFLFRLFVMHCICTIVISSRVRFRQPAVG